MYYLKRFIIIFFQKSKICSSNILFSEKTKKEEKQIFDTRNFKKKSGILNLIRRINKNQKYNSIKEYPQVKNYKYLGITLDEKLNFIDHFNIMR